MAAAEPSLAVPMSPVAKYFLATRPPFLAVTVGGCLVGLATANASGLPIKVLPAIATFVFAMVAHAGANVLNDYYDHLNGTDPNNTERIFPFTGGSRFITNGVITPGQALAFGAALMAVTMVAGVFLMMASDPNLFWFGVAGIFVGWAYSAPPFRLNSRGLDEPCIWLAWMIVAAGTDYVQRGMASPLPWIASAGYALLVTNILFINQFPDRKADEVAGKRHWVVRLGASRARHVYPLIGLVANACVVVAVMSGVLPLTALAALLALPLTLKASAILQRNAGTPQQLAPAIQATIGAAVAHAVLLSAGIAAARLFGN